MEPLLTERLILRPFSLENAYDDDKYDNVKEFK